MRIALVSRELAPFAGAGIGTYTACAARAWAAAGHEVTLVTADHPGLSDRGGSIFPGVELVGLAAAGAGRRPWFAESSLAVWRELASRHAARPFDAIEFPDYTAEGWALTVARDAGWFAGSVLVARLHTPTRDCRDLNGEPMDGEAAVLDGLEHRAIFGADAVVSPSASLLDRVRERASVAIGPAVWSIVPYPFDVDSARRDLGVADGPAPPGPDDRHPRVVYFGRLEKRKGVELLAAAARMLLDAGSSATFRFVGGDTSTGPGGGSMRAHLERLAGSGGRICIEPPRPRAELGELIRGAGVVCLPSLWENFPNACLEAMSLGAAVVGSDAGGMAEIIEPGVSGELFRSGDAASLADVLGGLVSDEPRRRRLAAAAPGRVRSLCDPATVTRRMMAVIESAGRARRGRPAISPSTEAEVERRLACELDRAGAVAPSVLRRLAARIGRRLNG